MAEIVGIDLEDGWSRQRTSEIVDPHKSAHTDARK